LLAANASRGYLKSQTENSDLLGLRD